VRVSVSCDEIGLVPLAKFPYYIGQISSRRDYEILLRAGERCSEFSGVELFPGLE
jgi:hypothetical protein